MSIATALISAVVVASFALEREAFAQRLMDLGVSQAFHDRKRDIADEFWTRLVERCREHYRVLGAANHGYWHDEQTRNDTKRTLYDAIVKRKVEVEFLFLKADGDLCLQRGREEQRNTVKDTLVSIRQFWEFRESLPDEDRDRLALKEYDSIPSCGITWVDDSLLVTHYLAGRNNLGSPGLLLTSGKPVFDSLRPVSREDGPAPLTDVYIRNYREIASTAKSTVITPERFAALKEKLRGMEEAEKEGEPSVSEADLRNQEEDDD